MVYRNPLSDLIQSRVTVLGLDQEGLACRLGYGNPIKAAGRVHALCYGHLTSRKSQNALKRLPQTLEVPPEVVQRAVAATEQLFADEKRQQQEERHSAEAKREAEWRAHFRAHTVIQTERTVPSQITICGLTGGAERWLVIPLGTSKPPITFVQQTLEHLPTHVPFFGRPVGFVVNYSPDQAVRYDLTGTPVEVLSKAYRVGTILVALAGKPVEARVLSRITGTA